jgi:hypothetical protein
MTAGLHLAFQAIRREKERRRREGAPEEVLTAVERDLGTLFLEHVSLEMQSGHNEQAMACLQSFIEFNCFSPDFEGV